MQQVPAALRGAVQRGPATRIGLEDVLVLPDGSPAADNALLARAARAVATRVRQAHRVHVFADPVGHPFGLVTPESTV